MMWTTGLRIRTNKVDTMKTEAKRTELVDGG